MEQKTKIQPTFQLAGKFLDLKTVNKNAILEYLEENMKLREMPIEQHARKKFLKY